MIRKSLIALATVATIATGTAATSQAKTFIDIDIGFPGYGGGFYGGGYGYGYYPGYCGWKWVAYKKWNHAHTFYKIKHKKVYICY
jgi:hypothetical protein